MCSYCQILTTQGLRLQSDSLGRLFNSPRLHVSQIQILRMAITFVFIVIYRFPSNVTVNEPAV